MATQSNLKYYPAQLYENKSGSYIGYYVFDPITEKMRRVRIKLNRIKKRADRRKYARQLIVDINQKLSSGWNPFLEQEAPKSFTILTEALNDFLKFKEKELRAKSFVSYKSDIGIFEKWIKNKKIDFYCINFSDTEALEFLNYMYFTRDVSARRYNNMLQLMSNVWEWFISNKYVKRNIFKGIKKKKERQKTRQIIPSNIIEEIRDHLKEKDKEFYAIMLLTFHGLLRPNEIVQLKFKHIEKNIIRLPPEISKNNKTRIISLSSELKKSLDLLERKNKNEYIFSKDFIHGSSISCSKKISKYWFKLRELLSLPKEYQFYSLKDTGIVSMIRAGISLEAVRDQAGHSSLAMTNKYVQIARTDADQQIVDKVDF